MATTIICAAAGLGSRFKEAGYGDVKPMLDVGGEPMIAWVLSNFETIEKDCNLVLLVQKEHNARYDFASVVKKHSSFKKVDIVEVDGLTDGALRTISLAEKYVEPGELIICNADQWCAEFSAVDFFIRAKGNDGAILTFKDEEKNPKWSFADVGSDGYVKRVIEKNPVSDIATVGLYFFNDAKVFFDYAREMFFYDLKYKSEYYLAPIYNLYCMDKKKVISIEHPKDKIHGLGTPIDLESFKKNYLKENG